MCYKRFDLSKFFITFIPVRPPFFHRNKKSTRFIKFWFCTNLEQKRREKKREKRKEEKRREKRREDERNK